MKVLIFLFCFLAINGFGQCYTSESNFIEKSEYSSFSKEIDSITYTTVKSLSKLFDVKIQFTYAKEKIAGNAEFNPSSCPSLDCYGTITLGEKLINECLSKKNGKERIIAVLAHEFGHAAQSKNQFPNLAGKWCELHADYLAGYYVGQSGLIENSLLKSFAEEFYSRGSDIENFFDPNYHGSPNERSCAFLEGYKMAIDYKFNFIQSYSAGVDYLISLKPCNINYILKKYSKTEITKSIPINPKIGNYFIQSSRETLYVKNVYGQHIATVSPENTCHFNGLPIGEYVITISKQTFFGRRRIIQPLRFQVVENKTSGISIKKTGLFHIKQYTIFFPK